MAKTQATTPVKTKVKVKALPTIEFETQAGYPRIFIAGADEVGRGCLAGPVVAGAIILPTQISFEQDPWLKEVNDSKILNEATRDRLAPLIYKWAPAAAIGIATVEEIDQINIFHASHLAIQRALQGLSIQPQHILIDGKFLPKQYLGAPATAVIKGDAKCLSIAAASIIAKVWRDTHMLELDAKFPVYGFAKHKGYPTPTHTHALQAHGITKFHRKSFKTVAALL
jgi:ribonuclease HII